MKTVKFTISTPEDYRRAMQDIANQETDGNLSEMVRLLVRERLPEYGKDVCCVCGRIHEAEHMTQDESGLICKECLKGEDGV